MALLTGGLGGARLAPALREALGPGRLAVVANVGDDLYWHGLRVCPDLDSVTYALAGLWDAARGWGRRGETFRMRRALTRFDEHAWFGVGDLDLALHLERTRRLQMGEALGSITGDLARRLGVRDVAVLPASERPSPTRIRVPGGGLLAFQEWYVRDKAVPRVAEVVLARGPGARAAMAAVSAADAVVFGPSNPVTSIGTILALRGFRTAIAAARFRIAVSPVVRGRPSRSRAVAHHARARARVLEAWNLEDRPAAIASLYAGLADVFVLDESDSRDAQELRRFGLEPLVTDLLDPRRLAVAIVGALRDRGGRPRRAAPG